ncbi:MAG: DUF3486 family protein [Treponema sp.]|jgi:hypothetical protein|nr:DUF3486 family protein [Treponema sp.]
MNRRFIGQLSAVDRLPEVLRNKVIKMLNNPGLYQRGIVETINTEAGEQVISKSSLCRFVQSRKKVAGIKRGATPPTTEESLTRIATAFERIAFSLENQYKKPS